MNDPDPLDMSGRTISGTGGKSIVAVGIFLAGAAMTLAPLTAAATSTGEAETMLSTDTDDGETDLPAGSNDGETDLPPGAGRIIGSPDAGPDPQHSGDRGGWAQLLTLGVVAGGVGFIMWRIISATRQAPESAADD